MVLAARVLILPLLLLLQLLRTCAAGLQSAELECAFSDRLQGAEPHSGGAAHELWRAGSKENGTARCHRGSSCYGLWEKRPDGKIQLVKQGCWPHTGSQEECGAERCLVSAPPALVQNGSYRFCCCRRHLCNLNFTEAPPPAGFPALRLMEGDGGGAANRPLRSSESALVALVTVAVAAVAIVAAFLGYRVMRGKKKTHGVPLVDVMESNSDAAVELDNLKLLELIGRGRYGTVYRGLLGERCVAVKLFSSANRQTFTNECCIYSLPLLQQHLNVARFLSAEQRTTANGRPEFLIVMDFYPEGSLSRYLSVHTVNWSTCCRMTLDVTRGLAFLHRELHRGDQYKPGVVHRDVSSRNVLVRGDLTCVLADFGLSMRLTGSRPCCPGDDENMTISEVGTVRYMAPEVLGGALNLRDHEAALKQVDVYALGLLLWETFRRCSHLFPGEAPPEYELAFQAELGNHPSFEEMQILVAREKARPRFPEAWEKNSSLVLCSLKETMEDCWDQDAEARLTAQCAEERLSELAQLNTHNHRNLSHCSMPISSASSFIEDHKVGVVNCLQGKSQQVAVIKTTVSGAEAAEKNRNLINQERQQRLTLPKQQNLTLRPTSLYHLSIAKETPSAFPQLKLEKHNHQQVETGVAKMNAVISAVEPHQVTTVCNSSKKGGAMAVPALMANDLMAKVQRNPGAGKQQQQLGDTVGSQREDLSTFSPDEQHPLLDQEQPLAQSTPTGQLQCLHQAERGPESRCNYNNNNSNMLAMGLDLQLPDSKLEPGTSAIHQLQDEPRMSNQNIIASSQPLWPFGNKILPSSQGENMTSTQIKEAQASPTGVQASPLLGNSHLSSLVRAEDPDDGSTPRASLPSSKSASPVRMAPSQNLASPSQASGNLAQEKFSFNQTLNLETCREPLALQLAALPSPVLVPQASAILRPHRSVAKAKRPGRPSSLDLSSSCICSDEDLLTGSLENSSGEKIKRRVKTPYTLKKWRPASWVVSAEAALDLDLVVDHGAQTLVSSDAIVRMSSGLPSQSKSSVATFLVGVGATAVTTSEPDGITSF